MSKSVSFYLESPTSEGESRNKNHEILLREWLCEVLASRKLNSKEVGLLGYFVDASRGLRYEIVKRLVEIEEKTDLDKRAIIRALRSLERKNLLLTAKSRIKSGVCNVYYLSMTYPCDFESDCFEFKEGNFPKLWDKVTVMNFNAPVGGRNNHKAQHKTLCVGGQNDHHQGGRFDHLGGGQNDHPHGALSPVLMGCDALPSSFHSFFINRFEEILRERVKSKKKLAEVQAGIEKLVREYSYDVVWERVTLIYADKGKEVIRPNFHEYLEQNLKWYSTRKSSDMEKERRAGLEKLASEHFSTIREGLTEASKNESLERPKFHAGIEQLIRNLGIDLQREYENYKNTLNRGGAMRGIEGLFITKFIMHYNKKGGTAK